MSGQAQTSFSITVFFVYNGRHKRDMARGVNKMPKSTSEANQEVAYELSNNLSRLLREFAKDFENRILGKLQASGYQDIRPSHSAVFANLGMGAVRVTELAERAQVTQQAMGKMLKEIERMGYVARDVDSMDKRAKEIRLTGKGIKLAEDSMLIVDQVRREYAQEIGEEDLVQLEHMLRKAVNKINLSYLPESWSASSPQG
jgi:DNA-binding MarR family transcriptional regulator